MWYASRFSVEKKFCNYKYKFRLPRLPGLHAQKNKKKIFFFLNFNFLNEVHNKRKPHHLHSLSAHLKHFFLNFIFFCVCVDPRNHIHHLLLDILNWCVMYIRNTYVHIYIYIVPTYSSSPSSTTFSSSFISIGAFVFSIAANSFGFTLAFSKFLKRIIIISSSSRRI